MAQNQQVPPSSNDVAGSALFKKFLQTAEGYIRQPTRLKKLLADAYTKASQKNDVGTLAQEAWETLQTMFRLVKASVAGEYTGVPGTTIAAAVAVLIYFLSPIDLIPDFIPVLGLLDDVALVAWFSTTLKGEIDKFHEWELTRPVLVAASGSAAPQATTNAPAQPSKPNEPAATTPQVAPESAKNAGTTPIAHPGSADAPVPAGTTADTTANATADATDGSGNRDAATDTGGNVR